MTDSQHKKQELLKLTDDFEQLFKRMVHHGLIPAPSYQQYIARAIRTARANIYQGDTITPL